MIPGQPTESLFPRGLGKVALHPRRPTTAIIPAALPSAAPPRLENQSRYEKSGLDQVRRALTRAIGETQLPAVLIEIDGLTRFSWILFGRPPRSEHELVTLYASIIALGAGLSAADLVRMVPGLGADSVG